ncbi:SLC13 family permease [Pyramidobacter piscolens]|uniref:SLC13 family permease n=1 Tax=Pyramidobacter piscolens TaxID=638849 RepID=UPI001FCA7870|nr:SLC13 family permease [Pyramidobacter piscolens]BDF77287.1 membrane protein [Pyramidobacter piscolens]
MDVLSLILFIVVIALAFFRKNNIGVLALAVGVVAVRLFGMNDRALIGAVNVSLFVTLVGITLLFAVITSTGALELLARKIIARAGKRTWMIPILIYLAGFTIVAVGPGGVPALAIIPPLAAAIAVEVGYNPLMLSLIGICGMTSGRFSPITPEGTIILSAVAKAGYTGNVTPAIWVNAVLYNLILAVVIYIAFKGYKIKATPDAEVKQAEKFSGKQIVALLSILVMLFLIVYAKVNLGLAALSVAAVLLVFHVADDSKCIKAIPWNTIILVLGVGALLSIVAQAGGIALLSDGLSKIMSNSTATPLMSLSAGLLSLVSSALGVVYPTMMPMCIDIAKQIGGVNPAALMSAVAAAGAASGISLMSTGGALIIAAIVGEERINLTKEDENKLFVQLLIISMLTLVLLFAVSWLFYGPVANVFSPSKL